MYPSWVRRPVLLVLAIIYLSNTSASTAYSRQQPAAGHDPTRRHALLALKDIYIESKSYDDLALRVRVKAQIADVLWPAEPDRARDMLTTAFDDATSLKQDPAKRRSLRSEIIRVAALRDRDLVKELIALRCGERGREQPARCLVCIRQVQSVCVGCDSPRFLARHLQTIRVVAVDLNHSIAQGQSRHLPSLVVANTSHIVYARPYISQSAHPPTRIVSDCYC
jgi:hypothetical protein